MSNPSKRISSVCDYPFRPNPMAIPNADDVRREFDRHEEMFDSLSLLLENVAGEVDKLKAQVAELDRKVLALGCHAGFEKSKPVKCEHYKGDEWIMGSGRWQSVPKSQFPTCPYCAKTEKKELLEEAISKGMYGNDSRENVYLCTDGANMAKQWMIKQIDEVVNELGECATLSQRIFYDKVKERLSK